jgi:hypothetical protein
MAMQEQTSSETAGADAGPPLGPQALEAFRRDLPRLLEERPGQWVAYRGDERIGFAASDRELYQEIHRRGFRRRDCYVGCIEEEPPDIVDSPYPFL